MYSNYCILLHVHEVNFKLGPADSDTSGAVRTK